MAKVYVEFEEPESCSKCPLFYATEGAFSDVCQLLNESDERVNTLKEKFSDCPLKKVAERENKLRQFEEGEIVCIKHYEAIKNFPILKEQVEDWKADHEHNLWLMKGLNERIAELKNEIAELKKENKELRCCGNCQSVFDADGFCYLYKDGRCINQSEWTKRSNKKSN